MHPDLNLDYLLWIVCPILKYNKFSEIFQEASLGKFFTKWKKHLFHCAICPHEYAVDTVLTMRPRPYLCQCPQGGLDL